MPRLSLPIGLDFSGLDRDLATVGRKIEEAGKTATIRPGVLPSSGGGAGAEASSAGAAAPSIDTGQISASFEQVGARLSGGIQSGLAVAAASMGQFTANISAMLDHLSGVSIATFKRIDSAIKFPTMNKALQDIGNVARSVGGGFGKWLALPVDVYRGFYRLQNFLSSIGGVGNKTFSDLFGRMKQIATFGLFGKATAGANQFKAATVGATSSVKQLGGAVQNVGRQILVAFGVVGILYKTVKFFTDGIKGASDLNETVSRSKVVFGDAFGPVAAQADKMNKAFGLSRQSQLDVASGFGAMAQGAGMTEEKSAALANQLTTMAADLSSSVNIPFQEAGEKIRSALAGQAEPLRQFGANITEDAVKAYALSAGLTKSKEAMSQQAAMTARAALIMRGLAYAQGDLERTSGQAANQFRKAGGGIAEFGVRIGELLLPAVELGTEAFNSLLEAALSVFEAGAPVIEAWAGTVTAAMQGVALVARNLGSFWKIGQLRVGEFVINTIAWIETIPANFGPMTEWLGRNWYNLLVDFSTASASAFTNLIGNAERFGKALWAALKGEGFAFTWTPLLEGFKATTEQLPELIKPALISVDDEVNSIFAEIGKKEAARSAALAKTGAAPKKPGAVAEEAKVPEYKLASALDIGSKEAYSIFAKGTAGTSGAKDMAKEGVKVAKDSHETLKQIHETLTRNERTAMAIAIK